MGTALLVAVIVFLTTYIAVQYAAAHDYEIHTRLTPSGVSDVIARAFVARLHTIEHTEGRVSIRPRYKKDAPVFSVTAALADDGGSDVTFAMEEWTSGYHRIGRQGLIAIPLGRGHALWVLRKRYAIVRRIRRLESVSTATGPR